MTEENPLYPQPLNDCMYSDQYKLQKLGVEKHQRAPGDLWVLMATWRSLAR